MSIFSALQAEQREELLTNFFSMHEEAKVKEANKDGILQPSVLGIPFDFSLSKKVAMPSAIVIQKEITEHCISLLDHLQPIFNHSLVELVNKFYESYFTKFVTRVNNLSDCPEMLSGKTGLSFRMHLMQAGIQHFAKFIDNRLELTPDVKDALFVSINNYCQRAQSSGIPMYVKNVDPSSSGTDLFAKPLPKKRLSPL